MGISANHLTINIRLRVMKNNHVEANSTSGGGAAAPAQFCEPRRLLRRSGSMSNDLGVKG